mgnify:CR=1 FL=1
MKNPPIPNEKILLLTTTNLRRWITECNAPIDSFFGALKTEYLHHRRFKTREGGKQVTFEYIEVFYNRIRRHTKIDLKYLLYLLTLGRYNKSKAA